MKRAGEQADFPIIEFEKRTYKTHSRLVLVPYQRATPDSAGS
jgi:hypothetical protein